MPGSLRLGRMVGIDIYLHLSWFIILVLLTWSLAADWFAQLFPGWFATAYWVTAFTSTLLLFVCVLIHELAHAFVAQSRGLTVRGTTLFIFGGLANLEEEVKRPRVEFQIAVVGPITSLLLAGLAFMLSLPLRGSRSPTEAVLDSLAVTNLFLGVFNLIPGFPLDGGRVLRSILWNRTGNVQQATRLASYVGQGCGYIFILLGIVAFFTGNFFNGHWTIFIGWFLLNTAQSVTTQVRPQSELAGVSVGQVMNPRPVSVPATISLQKLVDEYFLPLGLRTAPVVRGDYLVGLISLTEMSRVERERWSCIPVAHVMRLLEQVYVATPEQPLHEVLQVMGTQDINQVPVAQEGRLIGLLSRESIIRYLQVRQSLNESYRDSPIGENAWNGR